VYTGVAQDYEAREAFHAWVLQSQMLYVPLRYVTAALLFNSANKTLQVEIYMQI
jgi:hypothetical protein